MRKLTLILITLLFIFSCKDIKQNENPTANVDSLKIKNDSLTKALNMIKPESNYWFVPEYDGKKLIEQGISNPAEFIENNLREKPELIPMKAVLGGKMHFVNVQILSSEWLIADFEDGHVLGRAIYKYKLNDNDELEFEISNLISTE